MNVDELYLHLVRLEWWCDDAELLTTWVCEYLLEDGLNCYSHAQLVW